ncbi:DUF3305 domain-containing protein [Halomonas heilongjiangensis]|uniref:DUF3305 domain-containing protein n=1 Tax=Halomonas heilongjiangensis TaxID=1387883 RepID=A0A2N7TR10_9GAMM|nr:DUF3305 domain-containing protein [Halomonas heilongjiangensis]PMR70631.1 DUF3305 domain-containing protein [Halomonas heilongjiangensis]PXX88813.1 hypothetical protein CR158_12215 [Halomonas heilongjiangensis]
MTHASSHRPLSLDLASESRRVKGFPSTQWRIVDLTPGDGGPWVLTLQLYLTERAAYRFNLDAGTPQLFVRCGESSGEPRPSAITASQDVAASWLDGEQQVLEVAMPLALQAWLEAYLARHGEAPDEGRKKKRPGAGRAREQSA